MLSQSIRDRMGVNTITKNMTFKLLNFALWIYISFHSVCLRADNTPLQPSRYALVLENTAYNYAPLRNPRQDAELMQQTLQRLGFDVKVEHNLSREQLFATSRAFSEQLPAGSIAVVYYAGHGMQVQNSNYLIPVDMQPTGEASVPLKAFPLEKLIEHLHASPSAVNIIFLDACRNNPFRPTSAKVYRDFSNLGLAKVSTPKGTIVAFSTAPGQFAEDGAGRRNSLYTMTLAEQLQQPGLTIETALKNVADIVRKRTLDDQQPWYESSLVDQFYFLPPPDVQLLTEAKNKTAGTNANTTSSRGINGLPWYQSLAKADWYPLLVQLEKRIMNLTEDEVPLLEHRAKHDNVIAMTTLGLTYKMGFLQGQDNRGRAYRSGASNTKSIYWLQQAAEAGFPVAQYELAEMIFQGIGTDVDENQAMMWLKKASDASYPEAMVTYAQREAGIDPSMPLTAEGQLKTLQIIRNLPH